jgi:hypothetical protein
MAAAKRGKGGRFVKGGGKGPKKKRAPKATSSGATPLALLHSIDRKVSHIDKRLSMKAHIRLARIKGKAASRLAEQRLAAKYG